MPNEFDALEQIYDRVHGAENRAVRAENALHDLRLRFHEQGEHLREAETARNIHSDRRIMLEAVRDQLEARVDQLEQTLLRIADMLSLGETKYWKTGQAARDLALKAMEVKSDSKGTM